MPALPSAADTNPQPFLETRVFLANFLSLAKARRLQQNPRQRRQPNRIAPARSGTRLWDGGVGTVPTYKVSARWIDLPGRGGIDPAGECAPRQPMRRVGNGTRPASVPATARGLRDWSAPLCAAGRPPVSEFPRRFADRFERFDSWARRRSRGSGVGTEEGFQVAGRKRWSAAWARCTDRRETGVGGSRTRRRRRAVHGCATRRPFDQIRGRKPAVGPE